MGLEVVVRPVVLPNIRPARPRVLAKADNPDEGFATLSGGSGKFIITVFSWNVSVSRSMPRKETKRQYDVERVYQMDDKGNINKNNFIDVQRLKKVRLDDETGAEKVIYRIPEPRDNVEIRETDQSGGWVDEEQAPNVG